VNKTPPRLPRSRRRVTLRLSRLVTLLVATLTLGCGHARMRPQYSAPFPVPEMTPIEYPCLTEAGRRLCLMMLKSDYLMLERELIARCVALGHDEDSCLPE
jgi:hypothetical protein